MWASELTHRLVSTLEATVILLRSIVEIAACAVLVARFVPKRLSSRTQCTASIPRSWALYPNRLNLNRVRWRKIWLTRRRLMLSRTGGLTALTGTSREGPSRPDHSCVLPVTKSTTKRYQSAWVDGNSFSCRECP